MKLRRLLLRTAAIGTLFVAQWATAEIAGAAVTTGSRTPTTYYPIVAYCVGLSVQQNSTGVYDWCFRLPFRTSWRRGKMVSFSHLRFSRVRGQSVLWKQVH